MANNDTYRIAEIKIKNAQLINAWGINLRGMGLAELPQSLSQCKNMIQLDISDNELTTLPEWLIEFTHLKDFHLANNPLDGLPNWLSSLSQLHLLDVSGTQMKAVPIWFVKLTQLQKLDISNNELSILPNWMADLKQLNLLNISKNQLTTLPEWLKNLKLKFLDISQNRLVTLPEWLVEFKQLQELNLSYDDLATLPNLFSNLTQLQSLNISNNQLTELPESLGSLIQLRSLNISNNQLKILPISIGNISELRSLNLNANQLAQLPESLGNLKQLRELALRQNNLVDLPGSLAGLNSLAELDLGKDHYSPALPNPSNPLNPELSAAYKQGLEAVKTYLRAKATAQIMLNEAKLILVGEGEVGKTCLMDALLDKPWQDHPSTHGIEIQQVKVIDSDSKTEIILNGWDFGGQRVYRPTHQLFFSAPAVYLVVWKPREGPQQGFVREWIQLVKRREPTAKILVVATHGGPQQRQPDIDRQELWDLFCKETVIDFFHVESKPDEHGKRKGIEDLKTAIARVAAQLPEVGRSVPKSFKDVREALQERNVPYLPLGDVMAICREHKMDDEIARLFISISHRLGHLTHYQNDPTLRDIVILRPDWLATAMSYILDDEETRKAHGLVKFSRLSKLWSDPARPIETRYPEALHKIFLRLMERFDLSYRVAGISPNDDSDPISLIAQLVPDTRPNPINGWIDYPIDGNTQQIQICHVVDAQNGQSSPAEGLFYQLIVRLHKYSLGRIDYNDSVHWQRGLVLDDDYNGRALIEHIGNDIRITVRAPYPERFLAMLTSEVKYLVESFWEGLRCNIMVPCVVPCGKNIPGTGLFEVEKLIESKRRGRPEFPCPVCNEWQDIDHLLRNAPAAQPDTTALIFAEFAEVKAELAKARGQITYLGEKTMGRFDRLDDRTRRTLSRVDKTYADLLQIFTDEAKEGPRLFSLMPIKRKKFEPKEWVLATFRLTLWCEHSRLPLTSVSLNGPDSKNGVYNIELDREWFKKAAPFLKFVTGTLSLVLPVAASGFKLAMDQVAYKQIETQLDFSKEIIDAALSGSEKVGDWMGSGDDISLERGEAIRAQGATLRELQSILKAKDPGFGGLVRVMNKRQEFLWVHPRFEKEY